jgi:hypothetical protein
VQQEFSNVFHYKNALVPTPGDFSGIRDEMKTTLVALHSTDVSFVRYRVWSFGGTPAENNMLEQGTLGGTGSQATNASMDRERAFLIRWPAGEDIRGKPVYLRKWFHSCGAANGITVGGAVLQQTTALISTQRSAIADKANELRNVGTTEAFELCSSKGRFAEGNAQCHAWLEHHQLGDAWR